MATSIQIKRGATAKVAAYTPLEGELVLDLTTKKLYVGDGSTVGGNQIVASRKGITDGTSAATGVVGEVLTAQTATAVSMTTATTADLVSLTLSPGDWDLSGLFRFDSASSASISIAIGSHSPVSGTIQTFPNAAQVTGGTAISNIQIALPTIRVNISTATTYYLPASATFSVGTVTGRGYLYARRAR